MDCRIRFFSHLTGPARFLSALALGVTLTTGEAAELSWLSSSLSIYTLAQPTDEESANISVWQSTLDDGRDAAVRRTAARRLLEMRIPAAYDVLASRLLDFSRPERVRIIASAIRDLDPPAPKELLDTLLTALKSAPPDLTPAIVDALSAYAPDAADRVLDALQNETTTPAAREAILVALRRFPTTRTVSTLIDWLGPEHPATTRNAAYESLVALTGQARLGDSPRDWRNWWETQSLHGREGVLELYTKQLERRLLSETQSMEAVRRERDVLEAELVAALERQYALTPAGQRQELLSRLLTSPRTSIRLLGLSLVERAIVNAEAIDGPVIDIVVGLLDDRRTAVALAAVRQLALTDPARLSQLAIEKLPTVQDEELRRALLRELIQTPAANSSAALVEQLRNGSARPLAIAALLAATRRGLFDDQTLEEVGRVAIETAPMSRIARDTPPDEAELLARTPHEPAIAAAAALLRPDSGASNEARVAAARGLGAGGRHDESLIKAAADPLIYPFACQAVTREANVSTLNELLNLPAPTPEAQLEAIESFMARLPAAHAVEADRALQNIETVDLARRIDWLRRSIHLPGGGAGDEPHQNGIEVDPIEPLVKRTICLRLAELYLAAGRPEWALETIAAAPVAPEDTEKYEALRRVALLAWGRWDEAGDAASIREWLDAVEVISAAEPCDIDRFSATLDEIKRRFPPDVRAPHQRRIAALAERLAELRSQRDVLDPEGEVTPSAPPSQADNGDPEGGINDGDGG